MIDDKLRVFHVCVDVDLVLRADNDLAGSIFRRSDGTSVSAVEAKAHAAICKAKGFKVVGDEGGTPQCAEIRTLRAERDAEVAEVEKLRAVLDGGIKHDYQGLCPDDQQPTARDPECPACKVLGAARTGGGQEGESNG